MLEQERKRWRKDPHQIEPQTPLLVVPLSQKWPKQSQIIFSQHFEHYHLLEIIALCYHVQFQQNPIIFKPENSRKPHFGPFWPLLPKFARSGAHGWILQMQSRIHLIPVTVFRAQKHVRVRER